MTKIYKSQHSAFYIVCYYAECHLCCMSFMLSVTNKPFMLNAIMLSALNAECHYAECCYAECRVANTTITQAKKRML